MKQQPKPDVIRDAINLNLHTGYAAASERLRELQHQLRQTDARINEINNLFYTTARDDGPTKTSVKERAAALLAGEAAVAVDVTKPSELVVELTKLRENVPVLREAIQLQKAIVEREHAAASDDICERVSPQYFAQMRDTAQALIALGHANEQYISSRDSLINGNISWTGHFPPVGLVGGHPCHMYSHIARWLQEALKLGWIKRADVPAKWLRAWGV